MDTKALSDGYLIDIIDDEWRKDSLPPEDINMPREEYIYNDQDNEPDQMVEQQNTWKDREISNQNLNRN